MFNHSEVTTTNCLQMNFRAIFTATNSSILLWIYEKKKPTTNVLAMRCLNNKRYFCQWNVRNCVKVPNWFRKCDIGFDQEIWTWVLAIGCGLHVFWNGRNLFINHKHFRTCSPRDFIWPNLMTESPNLETSWSLHSSRSAYITQPWALAGACNSNHFTLSSRTSANLYFRDRFTYKTCIIWHLCKTLIEINRMCCRIIKNCLFASFLGNKFSACEKK